VTGGYAGHCDWRLPQIDELHAIADCSLGNPCIDQSAFGPTNASSIYWSDTSNADFPDGAWFVVFRDGNVSGNFKYSRCQVRAVRDGL